MVDAARRKRGQLTLRVWGLILGAVLILPLAVKVLVDPSSAMGIWPWKISPGPTFVYVLASPWLVLPFVVGMWLLFMAIVIGRRQRLFLWSFILLAWIYTLVAAGFFRMFGPMSAIEVPSFRALFASSWTTGGTWVGILLVAAVVLVIAIVERVLRRCGGRRVKVS
jgi:hypothetical protein